VWAAVDVIRPAAEAKRIDLRLALGDARVISADPARLQQVVWNLVSNAVKFTPDGGRVDLSVRQTRRTVTIEVADTGVGIDPDFLAHVFDRFRQFDGATTRRRGGLGLGLAIVRHLVELHGGTVTARSEGAGHGATFTVTIPTNVAYEKGTAVERADPPPGADVAMASVDLGGLRVLVVDDDDDSRSMLSAALTICGAEVFASASAEAGLTQAASIRPDVLVCDIGMPGMDGYEVARRLRQQPGLENVVLAALTGWGQKEDRRRTAEAGFNHHLVKPPEPKVVESLLAGLTSARG
jgi:CheY-like chemotaxis protein